MLVDGAADRPADAAQPGMPPQVVVIPIEQTQLRATGEFAFELARALAAQTARTGAVVFAERSVVPKARHFRARRPALGPLSGSRLEPVLERDGVLFFDVALVAAVSGSVRGQMPQVLVSATGDGLPDATATIVVAPETARPEYVELLRGELAAAGGRQVHVVRVASDHKGGTRGQSPLRALAWQLAAELVLAA